MTSATGDRLLPAIGLRLTSVGLFACMNVLIKLSEAHGASLGEIMFFRQGGAALLMLAIISAGPGLASVRTRRLPAHLLRMVVGLSAMSCTFMASSRCRSPNRPRSASPCRSSPLFSAR